MCVTMVIVCAGAACDAADGDVDDSDDDNDDGDDAICVMLLIGK